MYVSYVFCCTCGLLPSCTGLGRGLVGRIGGGGVLVIADHVQESAVGKYCSKLSGLRLLNSAAFLRNVGHDLLQLAWSSVLQDAQRVCFVRQLLVLWGPAQLPQVSFSSVQSFARWFHPWHFKHLIGSLLVLSTWHLLLQIKRPFVIALLAASALLRVRRRWAVLWLGDLRSTALAHLAVVMVDSSRLLASHISIRWSLSSGFRARGTLKAIIINVLFRNSAFAPILSHIVCWLSWFASQLAVSSFSVSTTIPPLLVLLTERILPEV